MNAEQDRLARIYRELGDEHLQDLAAEPDDLTDAGRLAVATEMRRRGFDPAPDQQAPKPDVPIEMTEAHELEQGFSPGIPGMFPSSAAIMEQALEPGGVRKDGMESLVSIYDGLELARACEILEAAEMEPAIHPIGDEEQSQAPTRFEIWLDARDIPAAKTLLRTKMGLFPFAEVDPTDNAPNSAEEASDLADDLVVGFFESLDEAKRMQKTLLAQGFHATIEEVGEDGADVLVPTAEHERALAFLASQLGAE